jgi:alpha-galactosidase/6-phospho-beta-glucosidase family protein
MIKEKFLKIVENSQLDKQDKNLWNKFVEVNSEETVSDIYEALKDDEKNIEFFTKNLKEKLDAFLNKDSDKLNSVIETEVETIKDL